MGAEIVGVDLTGARFAECDLTGVVMRGVEVARMDIDAPWLPFGGHLLVNGVDVIPYVESELDRRFPGRSQRTAESPEGLRDAWAALQRAWDDAMARAAELPEGAVDVKVAGEWSFAETLRHLVLATDLWLGRAVLELDHPFHPLGLEGSSVERPELTGEAATYEEVLDARRSRVAMVRDLLADVTEAELDTPRRNPHEPDRPETTRSCVHVVLEEEWEHLRFALRDLETLAAG